MNLTGNIEFQDKNTATKQKETISKLNNSNFDNSMLDEKSFYVICEKTSEELKNKIEREISQKFGNIKPDLSNIDWRKDGYVIYTLLKKEFNFPHPFEYLGVDTFSNCNEKVKYFGIDNVPTQKSSDNVSVLFYNNADDFAIKIKTIEHDEVILYRTNENKYFSEYLAEIEEKQKNYSGNKKLNKIDTLRIPYISLNSKMEYTDLCNKIIKNTNQKIVGAIQNIDFTLNERGGSVYSEASIVTITHSLTLETPRIFSFNDSFVLFLKQENASLPYFACKINDTSFLVKAE